MSTHSLKIMPEFFNGAASGSKPFEVRRDDRTPPYAVGDTLRLWEFSNGEYTGRETLSIVTYVLRDPAYCADGFCILGTRPLNQKITVPLPDGRRLAASDKSDSDYPGIKIDIINTDGTNDCIMWAEYNTAREDYSQEERLRLLLWNAANDEPTVNMAYDTGGFETAN